MTRPWTNHNNTLLSYLSQVHKLARLSKVNTLHLSGPSQVVLTGVPLTEYVRVELPEMVGYLDVVVGGQTGPQGWRQR
jgi:hypothetical protein